MDLAVPVHWGLVVQVQRCDIFDPDVSFCNVASGDPRSCRSNGSEHSEMAAGVAKSVSFSVNDWLGAELLSTFQYAEQRELYLNFTLLGIGKMNKNTDGSHQCHLHYR